MNITVKCRPENIENINVDDCILSYNLNNKKRTLGKVNSVFRPIVEKRNQVILSGEGFNLTTSKKHRMFSSEGWKIPNELNDLMNIGGEFEEVKVNQLFQDDAVFNDLEIEKLHCYFAGNNGKYYLSHNSASCYNNWWHYEIQDYIVLKNNGGTDDNRVKNLDYVVNFDRLFFERIMEDKDIALFSPSEVPGLFDAFGTEDFKPLYEKYEKDDSIRRKTIPAMKLMESFIKERIETGRIYAYFIDNEWNHGPWKVKVNQSNLCLEVTQPNIAISHIDDPDGEIGICILSAINVLETEDDELEDVCDVIVRLLDELIDYQEYPVKAGETFCKNRRSLGVGMTNFAAKLADKNLSYSSDKETLLFVDELMEKIQYYLLKSSCKLAKKKGKCNKFSDSKYSDGIMPQDRCHKYQKELVNRELSMEWEELRNNIKKYGLRHSTLTCQMPVDSSSIIQNSTHGIEPPRDLLIQKRSNYGTLKQIVPKFKENGHKYKLLFDCSNKDINSICAIIQKWMDMSISLNHNYDYDNYPEGKIPLSVPFNDILDAYKKGIKTLYYANSKDKDTELDENCESGACSI